MAFHFADVAMPLLAMHLRCVHFRSSLANVRPHIPEVLALIASGRIDPELVRTSLLPFGSLAETLLDAGSKPVYVCSPITGAEGEPVSQNHRRRQPK
jgi:alcohol dehydrogenase